MLITAFSLPACTEEKRGDDNAIPKKCALPTPDPGVRASLVPPGFLLEDMEVAKAHKTKERLSIALNNPRSVNESFALLKASAREAGFKIVGEDNEGFEAEIYLKDGNRLGAIQIRGSRCPEATVVFLNIVRT